MPTFEGETIRPLSHGGKSKKGEKHVRIKISRSFDGELRYKPVMTQSIYLSKSQIYVTQLALSEITTILFKNFHNVLTKKHKNNLLLFCDTYSNSRSSIFFAFPSTYSHSFPGKVLHHVISIVFFHLSPPPSLLSIFSPCTFVSISP